MCRHLVQRHPARRVGQPNLIRAHGVEPILRARRLHRRETGQSRISKADGEKLIIKGKTEDPDANKKFNQFLGDLGAQLHKSHPEASGLILAKVQYCNFGLMMMPTDVDVTFPNKREEPPYPQMEREIKEKLANYILANQYLPLYYINGKIKQVSWTIPIRINK